MAPPQESQLRLERDQKCRSSPGPASTAVTSTAGTRHGGPSPSWGSFLPAPPDSRETPTSLMVPKSSAPFRQTLIHHHAPCGFPRPGDNTQSHVSCAWGRHAANLGRGLTNWTTAPGTPSRASGSTAGPCAGWRPAPAPQQAQEPALACLGAFELPRVPLSAPPDGVMLVQGRSLALLQLSNMETHIIFPNMSSSRVQRDY